MSTPPPVFELVPNRFIGGPFPCYLIAEVGQNHQGDPTIAKRLIDIAKECGMDCIKFQKSDINSRFTAERLAQRYEGENSFGATYGEHRRRLELSEETLRELKNYATSIGLHFTATGMDKPSIDFLHALRVPFFKIGSADAKNIPLLRHVCQYNKPLIISTGMTHQDDVIKVYKEVFEKIPCLVMMQCTSCYPTFTSDLNLNVIRAYERYCPNAVIGYSGHELGTDLTVAAVAAGAKVVERHITLDHNMRGSDHFSSLDPFELKEMVRSIRKVEAGFGSFWKKMLRCEEPCYEKLGKTIVAARNLLSGTVIEEDMIDVKVAVEKGIDPILFDKVIGSVLKRDVRREETIKPRDLIEVINL